MKNVPLIAITPRYDLVTATWVVPTDYTIHLQQQHAAVIVVDPSQNQDHLETILRLADGFLFTGGSDISPQHYGQLPCPDCGPSVQLRDDYELYLARRVFQSKLPCLGICRGIQLLNVAGGGTLYQDIQSQISRQISHTPNNIGWTNPAHTVRLVPDSMLARIVGQNGFQVNSFHHQAVKDLAPGFRLAATAPDGVCEAIENPSHDFCLGIQWHPERMPLNDPVSSAIFKAFVDASR